jgi:hypothetical protein
MLGCLLQVNLIGCPMNLILEVHNDQRLHVGLAERLHVGLACCCFLGEKIPHCCASMSKALRWLLGCLERLEQSYSCLSSCNA